MPELNGLLNLNHLLDAGILDHDSEVGVLGLTQKLSNVEGLRLGNNIGIIQQYLLDQLLLAGLPASFRLTLLDRLLSSTFLPLCLLPFRKPFGSTFFELASTLS